MSNAVVFDLGLARHKAFAPRVVADVPSPRNHTGTFWLWTAGSIAATAIYFFISHDGASLLYDVIGLSAGLGMLVLFGAALLRPARSSKPVAVASPDRPPVRDLHLSMKSFSAWEVIRVRRVLGSGGMISMGIAGAALFVGLPLHAPEMVFLAAVYGMSGMLMVLASAVYSRA